MRILKFKTSANNLNSIKITNVANANTRLFAGYKGYLFSQDEEDRANNQYTVNVFFEQEGDITVTEYNSIMLNESCRHFRKLNSHANCKNVDSSYITDDTGNNMIYAKLTFSFE